MNRYQKWIARHGAAPPETPPVAGGTRNQKTVKESIAPSGPGTVLLAMLSYVGIKSSSSCYCRRHANVMDNKGTAWCLDNIDKIVGWLETEAATRKLPFFRAGVRIALVGLLKGYALKESFVARLKGTSFSELDSEWAVAVTTAPRGNENTLAVCLDSLITAGWYDPVVFAEPGSDVPPGIKVIKNETKRGCWHNWYYSAKYMLENTTASIIMTVQDDSLFHPDSRVFVEEHCLWPTEDTGIVSLYTAAHYSEEKGGQQRPRGINHVHTKCWWGTCAVVWKRETLQAVVDHEISRTWLGLSPKVQFDEKKNPALRQERVDKYYAARRENPALINNSDYVAGHVLNQLNLKKFFVDPSPVQHVSRVSTLQHGGNTGRRNCARCADHSISLEAQVGTKVNLSSVPKQKLEAKKPKGRGLRPMGEVNTRSAGQSTGTAPRLLVQIRSSYSDLAMSQYRWEITRNTILQSLAMQTCKEFDIQLICGPEDPLQEQKRKAFNKIAPTTVAPPTWYNQPHDGIWRRTSRIDDDDMVSVEFVRLITEQPFDGTECIFVFPNGYTWADGTTYLWQNPQSQFVTLQSNTRLTPYSFAHQYFRHLVPSVVVSESPHWMWIRHHGVLSGTVPGSISKNFGSGRVAKDEALFPYDYEQIRQSLSRSQEAEAYIAAAKASSGRFDKNVLSLIRSGGELTSLADAYKTDKGINGPSHSHQYSLLYEELFAGLRDSVTHILELGIGSSLLMWQEYFHNATIYGVDKKTKKISGERIITHRADVKSDIEFGTKFDIIIDDASHRSTDQRAAFSVHGSKVKSGGYYVIESLHAIRVGKLRWCDESPSMLDTCRAWVSSPPPDWNCSLYGDQLCVLRRLA